METTQELKGTVSVSMKAKRVYGLHQRLIAHTDRSGECWIWLSGIRPNGYGTMTVNGKSRLPHRVAYETYVGPIPDGLTVDHLCKNRLCCNPAHMEIVTRGENTLRGDGPSANQKRQTHCKRGHSLDDSYRHGNRRLCRKCRALNMREWKARRKANA